MAYETRRSRRLRLEAEEQERHRENRRAFRKFVMVMGLIAVFVVTCLYFASRDKSGDIIFGGATKSNQIKEMPKQSAADKISAALPTKLAGFNNELQIAARTGLADLPSSTSTAVVAIDLSDKGRGNVNYNGDVQFTSASTYKIYVAYAMIHDVETGRRNWGSKINGTTWETCLSRMIINSDNACPEAYIASLGYNKFNQIVDGLGVSDKTQFKPYDMRTSAADLALVLQKLYRGELMNETNKNKLYSLMGQQVYREGIPTGIGASGQVSDKVGFLDALLHDAGIVFGGKGDYVLVIMTNGESWPYIAKVAGYVNSVMNE